MWATASQSSSCTPTWSAASWTFAASESRPHPALRRADELGEQVALGKLDEVRVRSELCRLLPQPRAVGLGEERDLHSFKRFVFAHPFENFEAAGARHGHVEQQDAGGLARHRKM